jgi:hypothetical protein
MANAHVPTKACPHAWCRTLHRVANTIFAIAAIVMAAKQPWSLLFIAGFTVIFTGVFAASGLRPPQVLVADDLVPITPLVVRPGWAATAAAFDFAYVVNGPFALVHMLLAAPSTYVFRATADRLLLVLCVVGVIAFSRLAHYMATRPARPKRVLAPVPN